uniref:Uncharacterized protein n=1 Tax=Rhizophora mucronata TaxID=61149 RepID=A0A2P2MWS0_RHIMU
MLLEPEDRNIDVISFCYIIFLLSSSYFFFSFLFLSESLRLECH